MRRTIGVILAASIAVVLFAAGAGADGDAAPPAATPATKEWVSTDRQYALRLPADWTVKLDKADDAVIALSLELPGDLGHATVALFRRTGRLNERAIAAEWAGDTESWTKNGFRVVEGPRVAFEPVASAWIRVAAREFVGDEWIGVRVIRRNVLVLRFDFDKTAWPKIEGACIAATQSVTSTLPLWPEAPSGYRRVARGGYEFQVHPEVPEGEIDGVQKRLRAVETSFVKWHGAVEWSADAPFVVALNPTLVAATRSGPSIDGHTRSGNCADKELNRLCVVIPAKGELFAAPEFAREAWRSYLDQGGFDGYPYWVELGESQAASAEAMIGKPLPAVPDGVLLSIPKPLPRLDELSRTEHVDWDSTDAMFAYVAFFRLAPKPWKDAFAAFLKDGAASGDWRAAETKHLLSLDQAKLRDAAQGWLARNLTSVKPK